MNGVKRTSRTHHTSKAGFTIIESVLFLAISGSIMALLLVGWSSMINTQRYKDSVSTVETYIQDQLSSVYNPENERSSTLRCDTGGGNVSVTTGGAPQPRGQSSCVLLGRYVLLDDGKRLLSYPILGIEPATITPTATVEAYLKTYRPTVVTEDIGLLNDETTIPWAAQSYVEGYTPKKLNLGIAMIRSPGTGTLYTYIEETSPASATASIDGTINSSKVIDSTICIEPESNMSGDAAGVIIRAGATSPSSIEAIRDGSVC